MVVVTYVRFLEIFCFYYFVHVARLNINGLFLTVYKQPSKNINVFVNRLNEPIGHFMRE